MSTLSKERESATATYPADLQTIGDHLNGTITDPSQWLEKPSGATHIKLQALIQNLRYRIDGLEASATEGFQLAAGAESLIPAPNLGISIAPEVAGALYQAQWVK